MIASCACRGTLTDTATRSVWHGAVECVSTPDDVLDLAACCPQCGAPLSAGPTLAHDTGGAASRSPSTRAARLVGGYASLPAPLDGGAAGRDSFAAGAHHHGLVPELDCAANLRTPATVPDAPLPPAPTGALPPPGAHRGEGGPLAPGGSHAR